MTAKSPRIPKGSKEGGQFMPKWAAELIAEHGAILRSTFTQAGQLGTLRADVDALERQLTGLRSRLSTSTPLIIWNIAVLIAIAYLYCKAYVPGTP